MTTIVYNMDCMEGMKEYPDNYFDLAIVDPPYGAGLGEGGGGKGWFAKYWGNENLEVSGGGYKIPRTGFHGKNYPQTLSRSELEEEREMVFPELEANGQRSSEKNHFVGCAA